jgi:hypothetical protein
MNSHPYFSFYKKSKQYKLNFFTSSLRILSKQKKTERELGVLMQPRLIRLRDAPKYLGMDRNRFNNEVRPFLVTLKIGLQGIAFDRLDLDQWVDDYKKQQGKPPAQSASHWQEPMSLIKEKNSTKKIKNTVNTEFQQLVEQLAKKSNIIE